MLQKLQDPASLADYPLQQVHYLFMHKTGHGYATDFAAGVSNAKTGVNFRTVFEIDNNQPLWSHDL